MNFYSTGQRDALATFLKEADYADSLAGGWEKLSPTKVPLGARAAGGLFGGAMGVASSDELFQHGMAKGFPKTYSKLMGDVPAHDLGGLLTHAVMSPITVPMSMAGGAVSGAAHAAPVVGGSAAAGALMAGPLYRSLVKNRRAAAIRRIVPKASMAVGALGAAGAAAAIAHHVLSNKDE